MLFKEDLFMFKVSEALMEISERINSILKVENLNPLYSKFML